MHCFYMYTFLVTLFELYAFATIFSVYLLENSIHHLQADKPFQCKQQSDWSSPFNQ